MMNSEHSCVCKMAVLGKSLAVLIGISFAFAFSTPVEAQGGGSVIVKVHGYHTGIYGSTRDEAISKVREIAVTDAQAALLKAIRRLESEFIVFGMEMISMDFQVSGVRQVSENQWIATGHATFTIQFTAFGANDFL